LDRLDFARSPSDLRGLKGAREKIREILPAEIITREIAAEDHRQAQILLEHGDGVVRLRGLRDHVFLDEGNEKLNALLSHLDTANPHGDAPTVTLTPRAGKAAKKNQQRLIAGALCGNGTMTR
jgi:hypothetical protein